MNIDLTPYFLWTDILIYLLLLMVIVFAIWSHSKEHLRAPWRQLMRNKIGVAAMTVLLFYAAIALLDSIHLRITNTQHYSTQEGSVLDFILSPLNNSYENTYSAPFARHLYVKNTKVLANGKHQQFYPRLNYVKASNRSAQLHDLKIRIARASLVAILIWLIFVLLICISISLRYKKNTLNVLSDILRGKSLYAWRTLWISLLIMFLIISNCYLLSRGYHIFGTDKVGQDVFYQTVKSIRTGLIIGTLTTLVMLPFAVFLGTAAGYFGKRVDDVIQYLYTTLNSIPGVLLIAAAVLSLQIFIANHPGLFPSVAMRADARLLALCVILGITSWTTLCRLLRGETLKLREVDYIAAAKAQGVTDNKIILRHILPNVMHIVIITVVLDFSGLVLAEAVLSYVGVGVDPTTYSWGNMINAARLELSREPLVWWPILAAFVFMFILVLSANFFSDAVRDAFDPRLRKM